MIKETIAERRWFKLDNAAKIYPIVQSAKNSGIYRMSVIMKDKINPLVLKEAIIACRNRFPSFFVRLRRGFFWYYYDVNDQDPFVSYESPYICQSVNLHTNNHHMFTFFFHENKISLEMFHSLSDGGGAFEFLKAVLFQYLELLGKPQINDGSVFDLDDLPQTDELEDSYLVYNKESAKIKEPLIPAYRITGRNYQKKGISINVGQMDARELKEVAKRHDASIAQLLVANLIQAICLSGDKRKLLKSPVTISVPVNLRKHFPSKTVRNFSLYFNTSFEYQENKADFATILAKVKSDFAIGLTKEHLQSKLNQNMSFEKSIFIRIIPLFLKKLVMKIGYKIIGHKPITSSLTNFGSVSVPKTMADEIFNFEFNLASVAKPGIAVVTFNNLVSISFTSSFQNKDLEKHYFRFLTDQGIKVALHSNFWK
jgi:NRPS condensation-like uncharacterized protein